MLNAAVNCDFMNCEAKNHYTCILDDTALISWKIVIKVIAVYGSEIYRKVTTYIYKGI